MLDRSAAAVSLAVALALGAGATAHAEPAPSYYPTLDDCLSAMSRYKSGPAQCVYIESMHAYELRVPDGGQ
ncbi:hypothetical protein F5X71_32275 [Nocardia brasiliensis]|uniref:DUF3551 domain-containing protein n=1 Tax=Nocardia brasiliensis TaxID=37326 RepID=A0A6G9XZW6_NOCBR|nr:hypothetical protein [Nocardia brasiliensis]QIS06367.1 hypothetical protein F5X71_32275 [Nocardia brasiliensis]